MVYNTILELIGQTPTVRLNKLTTPDSATVYVKLESFNPSGSVKDRAALGMIEALEASGDLKPGDTIVEPTSGNTGIGIALIGAVKGYKVVLTMPDTLSVERRRLLAAYGAELVLTEGAKGMKGAIAKAEELVAEKGYIILQQFLNPANPDIHRRTTAREVLADVPQLDAFVAGVGTGGTLSGVGEVLKKHNAQIEVIGVEPAASPVLTGGAPSPHKIQGIGAGFVPVNYHGDVVDSVVQVSEADAFEITQRLAREEGIFVGISSGAAVWAALQTAKRLGAGKQVVVVAPDNGARYLSIDGLF